MNSRISNLVEIVFDNIPYSLETSEAQENIESALEAEYIKLCEDRTEGEALDELLSEYGKLTKMAQLAGYSDEQAKAWRNAGDTIELKSAKKMINKQRRLTYLSSVLCVAAFVELLWAIYDGVNFKNEFFFEFIMTVIYAFFAFKSLFSIFSKREKSGIME
ncbi:MAG: hypothetical protein K2K89_05255 [Ruminococcus sp.]|nr:hypothetical protein [Ruminococcus sp.]